MYYMEFITLSLKPILINVFRYFIFAGIPFLVMYKWWPKKFINNQIQKRLAKNKDFLREILHSMQTSVIIGLVIAVIAFTPLQAYTQIYRDLADFPIWWLPVSVFLALVLHDTYFYWMHRALHHPSLYKMMHLEHHKSTSPSPWAAYSFHFFEGFTEALIVPLVFFLIPMHPIALAIFGLTSFIINVYGHLGFEIAPKWLRHSWFFEIVNTSVHHNLHHEKFKGNYGLYFRIWDRLMGTENPDYVKEFDVVQERRFGQKQALTSTVSIVD